MEERSNQNLFFQFSLNWRITSRLSSSKSVTNGYRHWRFFVSVPGWTQDDSYRNNVVVGLNGWFLHTAQLGANCLNGTGRGDLGNASTTTRMPQDGNRKAQEGAIRGKRLVSLSPVGFRHH